MASPDRPATRPAAGSKARSSAANGRRAEADRRALAAVGALAAVLLALLAGLVWMETRTRAGSGNLAAAGDPSGAPAVGGPFHLVDQDGRPTDQHLLDGKWSAVFFGYTYCPDVCPTTLQALRAAGDRLGSEARDFQTVLITVDPQRDTPAALKAYIANQVFPRNITALTGSAAQVAAAEKAYRVYAAKSGSGDSYLMDHSAVVYLMDPKGRFSRPLAESAGPDGLADQIRQAMRPGA